MRHFAKYAYTRLIICYKCLYKQVSTSKSQSNINSLSEKKDNRLMLMLRKVYTAVNICSKINRIALPNPLIIFKGFYDIVEKHSFFKYIVFESQYHIRDCDMKALDKYMGSKIMATSQTYRIYGDMIMLHIYNK